MTVLPASFRPMEAASRPVLPEGDGWRYEPKWDGFRCIAVRQGGTVRLSAKSGKALDRFFPEVVDRLLGLSGEGFALDGELIAGDAAGGSFSVLQQRLHPAESRILRLSRETPATYVVFDLLVDPEGRDLRDLPLRSRLVRLGDLVSQWNAPGLRLGLGAERCDEARAWLDGGVYEGVVAKRLDDPYREGERAMTKVKRRRTADCVVGGYRKGANGEALGALLLGLYDASDRLNHVGFTSGFAAVDRDALAEQIHALEGGTGFTGKAPGGPSRWSSARSASWSPLKPALVVEVAFDQAETDRFRHGTRLIRLRPDKAPRQCRMEQLLA